MSDAAFDRLGLVELAQRAIQRYARGLISVDWLYEQLARAMSEDSDKATLSRSLEMVARGLCSGALCAACLSSEESVRERGFENLRNYLGEVLAHTVVGVGWGAEEVRAEALQQAMVEIFKSLCRRDSGPVQPAAFLKWARVILFRQLARCRRQVEDTGGLSLEEQAELTLAKLIDRANTDPLEAFLRSERLLELKRTIASMRNPQYRAVLVNIFFRGLEERELAALWRVRVRDISLWRCRALKALRRQPGIQQFLW
jgi:DNA-directed RNA polymerase specialized sigma24 family protein